MIGRELSRKARDDGFTEVTVALEGPRQGVMIVPTDLVDAPGYQDMLDAYATKHQNLVGLVEHGIPL